MKRRTQQSSSSSSSNSLPAVHMRPILRATTGPAGARVNDYVVDPLIQQHQQQLSLPSPPTPPLSISVGSNQPPHPAASTTTTSNSGSRVHHKLTSISLLSSGSTLTHKAAKQRTSSPPPPPAHLPSSSSSSSQTCVSTIKCAECARCRCLACTKPRTLPQTTLCQGRVTCSPDAVVEMCTCVTAARYVFYYSLGCDVNDDEMMTSSEGGADGYDDEGQGYYDAVAVRDGVARQPCACSDQPYCCQRWTCLLSGALLCPCLCLYWPLTGCLRLVECLHDRCHRRGCRCKEGESASASASLLESSISSTRPLLELDNNPHSTVITSCPTALRSNGDLYFSWPSRTWRERRREDEADHVVVVNPLSSSAPPAVPPRTPPSQGQGRGQTGLGPASVVRRPRAPSPIASSSRHHHSHPRLLSASIDQETGEVVTSLMTSVPCRPPPVVPPRSRTSTPRSPVSSLLGSSQKQQAQISGVSASSLLTVDRIEPKDFSAVVPPPLPPKQNAVQRQEAKPSSSPLVVVHHSHSFHLNNTTSDSNSSISNTRDSSAQQQQPHHLQAPPLPAKLQTLDH